MADAAELPQSRRITLLFLIVFVGLTGLMLVPVHDDSIVSFGGFFHLCRRLAGADPKLFFQYLSDSYSYASRFTPVDPGNYHAGHVRYSWGFVYPLLATLYAVFAEGFRRLLPPTITYLELLVRAGNAAMVAHWMILIGVIAWALRQFHDPLLRASVAGAATAAVIFDYFVQNNWVVFNGHHLFGYLHDGSGFALTVAASRGAVAAILGLYLAARALHAEGGRCRLIPPAFFFHLAVAIEACAVLTVAEAVGCAVRRKMTPDLRMLGASTVVGLIVMGTVGSTGYPDAAAGVLPAEPILRLVFVNAVTHPAPVSMLLVLMSACCLAGGLIAARRRTASGLDTVLLVSSVMAGLLLVKLSTGQAIMAHLVTWYDNPSVHSLLYLFTYSSSAVAFGISLWLFVRLGTFLAGRTAGRLDTVQATALAASVGLLIVWVGVAATSPTRTFPLAVRPQRAIGEPFLEIVHPERWYRATYAKWATHDPSVPNLPFADRQFWIGKDWVFNAVVYLRSLHQWVVLGPTELHTAVFPGGRELREQEIQEQPPEEQGGLAERRQFRHAPLSH